MTRVGSIAFLLSGLVAFSVLFASHSLAQSCAQWDLTGHWQIRQSNGWTVDLALTQDPNGEIRGSANFAVTNGLINRGSLVGNHFTFVVDWAGTGRGEYKGKIKPDGTFDGTTLDIDRPQVAATWSVVGGGRDGRDGKVICKTAAVPAAPASAPEISSKDFCEGYANQAVQQAFENERLKCGELDKARFSGPRWDTNRDAHFNWCMTLKGDQKLPNSEIEARIQEQKDCIAAKAATPPSPAEAPPNCNVIENTDVYDVPQGKKKHPDDVYLREGSKVTLTQCSNQYDNWCHVQGKEVPTGNGWVWDGTGHNSLDCH